MMVIEFVFEVLFHSVCGWVGRHFVKLATLGRVDMEWESGSEAVLADAIGALVLFSLALAFLGGKFGLP